MRKILIFLLLIVAMSCEDSGTALVRLNGNESKLPPELKGLKVYTVYVEGGETVRVALLNNKVNSLTYYQGSDGTNTNNHTVIMIDGNSSETKIIHAKQILSETDSIIVLKK